MGFFNKKSDKDWFKQQYKYDKKLAKLEEEQSRKEIINNKLMEQENFLREDLRSVRVLNSHIDKLLQLDRIYISTKNLLRNAKKQLPSKFRIFGGTEDAPAVVSIKVLLKEVETTINTIPIPIRKEEQLEILLSLAHNKPETEQIIKWAINLAKIVREKDSESPELRYFEKVFEEEIEYYDEEEEDEYDEEEEDEYDEEEEDDGYDEDDGGNSLNTFKSREYKQYRQNDTSQMSSQENIVNQPISIASIENNSSNNKTTIQDELLQKQDVINASPQINSGLFHIIINGTQSGPFDLQELKMMVQSGQITRQTYVWKQGMANWDFAGNVAELASIFAPPAPGTPPPPPPPPMP